VYQLTKCVCTNKPTIIIQAGVAGSFSSLLPLGAVAIVENEMIGDAGVEEEGIFKTLFDLNLAKSDENPWQNKMLHNNSQELLKSIDLPKVNAISVNEITTANKRINYFKKENISLESLEGAALHYVALSENIPFLQLRSVSNFVGERNKTKWELQKAISHLNTELQKIIFKLI
jgi:futalosine hydrolase